MDHPEQFLYGYRGPWPQQSQVAPETLPPTAILLPESELSRFNSVILRRYRRQWALCRPGAWMYALRKPGLEPVSDAQFAELLTGTTFCRMLNPQLDAIDERIFADDLRDLKQSKVFKIDYTAMANLIMLPGLFSAPTVTLLKQDDEGLVGAVAIAIRDVVLHPGDGDAWELAKYFVLQGAGTHLLGFVHPRIHFALNSVNALAKTLLPKSHVLLNLLLPHFDLQLPLDNGVLFSPKSVGWNRQCEAYTPMCYDTRSFHFQIHTSYFGMEGNSSYPAYRFETGVGTIHADYGVFLDRYYQTILKFTRQVLAAVPADDAYVLRWVDACCKHVPGFPDTQAIRDPELLAAVAATIICNNSVCHTADHHNYTGTSQRMVPLRMRVPPPHGTRVPPLNRKKLVRPGDVVRHRLADAMFFRPSIVTRLIEVDYNFDRPELRQLNRQFHDWLRETDKSMPVKRFAPLNEIASSIQF